MSEHAASLDAPLGNQILLIGSASHTEALFHELKHQGLNAWRLPSAGEVSLADKARVKACVVCQTANAKAAQQISQGLSRMGVGPLWVLLHGTQHTEMSTQGTYHAEQLVRDIADSLSDLMPLSGEHGVAKIYAPRAMVGQSLNAADWPSRLGVSLLGVQAAAQACVPCTPHHVVALGDCYVVTGSREALQALARQPLLLATQPAMAPCAEVQE